MKIIQSLVIVGHCPEHFYNVGESLVGNSKITEIKNTTYMGMSIFSIFKNGKLWRVIENCAVVVEFKEQE